MDKECQYFHALKFKNESDGMCFTSEKLALPLVFQTILTAKNVDMNEISFII